MSLGGKFWAKLLARGIAEKWYIQADKNKNKIKTSYTKPSLAYTMHIKTIYYKQMLWIQNWWLKIIYDI